MDSRNKRFFMLSWGDNLSNHPNPDGDIANAPDREEILGLYPGFTLGESQPPGDPSGGKQRGKRRDRR